MKLTAQEKTFMLRMLIHELDTAKYLKAQGLFMSDEYIRKAEEVVAKITEEVVNSEKVPD